MANQVNQMGLHDDVTDSDPDYSDSDSGSLSSPERSSSNKGSTDPSKVTKLSFGDVANPKEGLTIKFKQNENQSKIESRIVQLNSLPNIETLKMGDFIPSKIRQHLLKLIPKWSKLIEIDIHAESDDEDGTSVEMHKFYQKLFKLIGSSPELSSKIKLSLFAAESYGEFDNEETECFQKTLCSALATGCTFSRLYICIEQVAEQLSKLLPSFQGVKIERLFLTRSDVSPNGAVDKKMAVLVNSLASDTLTELDYTFECSQSENETIRFLKSIKEQQLSMVNTYCIQSACNPYDDNASAMYINSCQRLLSTIQFVLGKMPKLSHLSFVPDDSDEDSESETKKLSFEMDSFQGIVGILMKQAEHLNGEMKANFFDLGSEVFEKQAEIVAKLEKTFPADHYKIETKVSTSEPDRDEDEEGEDDMSTRTTFHLLLTHLTNGGNLKFEWSHIGTVRDHETNNDKDQVKMGENAGCCIM